MSTPLGIILDKPILGFTLLNSGKKVALIQRDDFGVGDGEQHESQDCENHHHWACHDGLLTSV